MINTLLAVAGSSDVIYPLSAVLWPAVSSLKVEESESERCSMHSLISFEGKGVASERIELFEELLGQLSSDIYPKCDWKHCIVSVSENGSASSESYYLRVSKSECFLSCDFEVGCVRGAYTLSQIPDDDKSIPAGLVEISDSPSLSHRGLLLDTARRFLSVDKILNHLELLARSKMNVLHWHVSDDHSFSLALESTEKAFHYPGEAYSMSEMALIVNFAEIRGIRILLEIDIPGHTRALVRGYPYLRGDAKDGIDPTKETTFDFLNNLFEEISRLGLKSIHLGGDETGAAWETVEIEKWAENRFGQNFKKGHIINYWLNRVVRLAESHGLRLSMWNDFLREGGDLIDKDIVEKVIWQVWLGNYSDAVKLGESAQVIYSSEGAYYLDHLDLRWDTMFSSEIGFGVLGGETCQWGEWSDEFDTISRVWPRAAAVGGRLWNLKEFLDERNTLKGDPTKAAVPLASWVCHVRKRGLQVGNVGNIESHRPVVVGEDGTDLRQWVCPKKKIIPEKYKREIL